MALVIVSEFIRIINSAALVEKTIEFISVYICINSYFSI